MESSTWAVRYDAQAITRRRIGMLFACIHPERIASLTVIAGVSELDSLMRAAAESWAVAAECGAVPFFRCMLPWAYSSEYRAQNQQLLRDQEEAMTRLPPDYFAAFKLIDCHRVPAA